MAIVAVKAAAGKKQRKDRKNARFPSSGVANADVDPVVTRGDRQ